MVHRNLDKLEGNGIQNVCEILHSSGFINFFKTKTKTKTQLLKQLKQLNQLKQTKKLI
jgi:ribosomal protein S8